MPELTCLCVCLYVLCVLSVKTHFFLTLFLSLTLDTMLGSRILEIEIDVCEIHNNSYLP